MTNLNDVLLAMSNIPVDDPIAEIWGRGLQGGRYTVIEYTGALPITINANGEPLIDYRIYGNTVQNGTPKPENPITPIGCGERTENLFDIDKVKKTSILSVNGTTIIKTASSYNYDIFSASTGASATIPINCMVLDAGDYTIFYTISQSTSNRPLLVAVCPYASSTMTPEEIYYDVASGFGFILSEKSYVTLRISPNTPVTLAQLAIISGSTPFPYEPYGYKLPILSNSTVTNIYLGKVETTRRIKKLVLTGGNNESWSYNATYKTFSLRVSNLKTSGLRKTTFFCTHYIVIDDGRPISKVPNNAIYTDQVDSIYIMTDAYTSVGNFKSYLAAQYAAGTPVTVWYVLAEPETGIINELLMKIGNYADTLSMEQAGVSIPTNNGSTVINYDGTTKPSQMYIKYQGVKND